MQGNDIGDHFLLWPTLHAVNGTDDKRPTWDFPRKADDFHVWELGKDKEPVPFEHNVKIDDETFETLHESFVDNEIGSEELCLRAMGLVIRFIGDVHRYFSEDDIENLSSFVAVTGPTLPGRKRAALEPREAKFREEGQIDLQPRRALSKSGRRKIRESVEKYFPHLTTEVIRIPDKRTQIRFRVLRQAERSNRSTYIHFTLLMKYFNIEDKILSIAKHLRVPASSFTYAENKNVGPAIVHQRVCGRNVNAGKLQTFLDDEAASFVRATGPLSPVDSFGNHFSVFLGNIATVSDPQREILNLIQSSGFINYYGPECFGPSSCPFHVLGLHALRKSFGTALRLYLFDQAESSNAFRRCASELKFDNFEANTAENFTEALELCPRSHQVECAMLEILSKDPSSYKEAWECIAEDTRMGHYKAVQCYIWNRMVSKRLESFGHLLAVGDSVLDDSEEWYVALQNHKLASAHKPLSTPIKILTDQDVAETERCPPIYDLVMPLVSNDPDVVYPAHKSCNEAAYMEELRALGVQELRNVGLPGAYRRVFFRPFEFTWHHLSGIGKVNISCHLPKGSHINAVLREVTRIHEE